MAIVRVWHVTPTRYVSVPMDASSLDEATRQLPGGYYSTFRTFAGGRRVLGLRAHLRRLYDPVPAAGVEALSLRRALRELLEPFRPGEARVRAVMTARGQAFVVLEPLKPLPREVYARGVRVETTELQREHPRLKATGFIASSQAERKHIAAAGIFEALLVKNGRILEGLTSNFFHVGQAEGRPYLGTARAGILPGITRQTVIDLARGRGLAVKFLPLKRDQLSAAAEAFITSSSRGIVPVIRIDEVTVGQGRPGPITRALMDAYPAYVLEKAEEI